MKFLSRSFTRSEKLLLIVLCIILLGLVYYKFVDQPVRESITNSESECAALQQELDTLEQRAAQLRGVQKNMDALEGMGNLSWMGSYNNNKAEVDYLNDILSGTLNYTINFSNVTRKGDQIRRNFTLKYDTEDYDDAREITERLCNGENRCIVGDVQCTINKDGIVTISESATFFETMVGGTPDAGLPSDSASRNY